MLNFHHLGILTKDIEGTYSRLSIDSNLEMPPTLFDPIQKVYIVFITLGGIRHEIVMPAEINHSLSNLTKKKICMYHIAYEVKSIDNIGKTLRKKGFIPIDKPKPAIAFDNRLIQFFLNKDGYLMELINEK